MPKEYNKNQTFHLFYDDSSVVNTKWSCHRIFISSNLMYLIYLLIILYFTFLNTSCYVTIDSSNLHFKNNTFFVSIMISTLSSENLRSKFVTIFSTIKPFLTCNCY